MDESATQHAGCMRPSGSMVCLDEVQKVSMRESLIVSHGLGDTPRGLFSRLWKSSSGT